MPSWIKMTPRTSTKLQKQMDLADAQTGIIYGQPVLFYSDGHKRDYA